MRDYCSCSLDSGEHCWLQMQDGVLTDQQMAESGIGLIIAGNDTSGLGVSALMSILPLFPEVMEKLRKEQQQVRKI